MPEGTPITTNVAVKDIKTWYDSKGGGYVSEVIFEDGVSLKLLHQSPKMQSKVKGGASKGSDRAAGDIQSQLERQQICNGHLKMRWLVKSDGLIIIEKQDWRMLIKQTLARNVLQK